MGNLMNMYVSQIGMILIELLHLTKEFMRNLKLSYSIIGEDNKIEDSESEADPDNDLLSQSEDDDDEEGH
jgi:hypothetical protein